MSLFFFCLLQNFIKKHKCHQMLEMISSIKITIKNNKKKTKIVLSNVSGENKALCQDS